MPAHLVLDLDRWLAALPERRSRREYEGRSVASADLDALQALATDFRPWNDARCVVVREAPPALFTGIVGAYGRVSGAASALVFLAAVGSPTAQEHCGYTGEGLVLEASARGLATCWVGGFFSGNVARQLVEAGADERILAVSPVGYATPRPPARERMVFGAGKPKRRRALDVIAPGHAAWPVWAQAAVGAARVAPSAMHRQPWRFRFEDGALVVAASGVQTPRLSLRLDCGIAMLHAELGARGAGRDGAWEALTAPDVARWVPVSRERA